MADITFRQGDFEGALNLYNELLTRDPSKVLPGACPFPFSHCFHSSPDPVYICHLLFAFSFFLSSSSILLGDDAFRGGSPSLRQTRACAANFGAIRKALEPSQVRVRPLLLQGPLRMAYRLVSRSCVVYRFLLFDKLKFIKSPINWLSHVPR